LRSSYTSSHIALLVNPTSSNNFFIFSIFLWLQIKMDELPCLALFIFLLIPQTIYVVLENIFSILVVNILVPGVNWQRSRYMVKFRHRVKMFLLLKEFNESFTSNRPPFSCFLSFTLLNLLNVLEESLLAFRYRLETLWPRVSLYHSVRVVPSPGCRDSLLSQKFLKQFDRFLLTEVLE